MRIRHALICVLAVALTATPVAAQSYRVRLDARAQSVSFRGLAADSILATEAVASPNGGLQTADGYAVRCTAGTYCFYFRAGPDLRAIPITTSASVTLWNLGVQGLSFRGTGRVMADAGDDEAWPGTRPSAQLIEGFLEYERSFWTARAGRQVVTSRLEPIGFDGAWARARVNDASLEFAAYGGWGLGQASALTATSPALNPLDEWRPRDRQIVAGLEGSWFSRFMDARAEYRREMDPEDGNFVSERAALSLGASVAGVRAFGGVDYNMAEGHVGTMDATLAYTLSRLVLTAGAKHYQPYFSLWTLWGAFSPVPYNAINGSVEFRALEWLSLYTRGERFQYEDAEASTGLVPQLEDRGWRASGGGTATLNARWMVDANYHLEFGPGAAARFADAAVRYTPSEQLAFDAFAGSLARPLELRTWYAQSRWFGARAEWTRNSQSRLWADGSVIDDHRHRPDASAWSVSRVQLRAGVSASFGSGADRMPLPPARRPAR